MKATELTKFTDRIYEEKKLAALMKALLQSGYSCMELEAATQAAVRAELSRRSHPRDNPFYSDW